MSIYETYTAEEIIEILTDLDIDANFESASENEVNVATIDCEVGPFLFFIFLMYNEPFFEGFKLFSVRFDVDYPFVFANAFNESKRIARVSVEADEEGEPRLDEDGMSTTNLLADVSFAGGVTKDHVRFLLQLWIEDLLDFNEVSLEDDEEEIIEVPELQNLPAVTLQVQITACLSGGRSMTAREMSRVLEVDRHDLNSILYKERNRFEHNGEQPPRWSLKKS
jgi:hypothetical protein